MQKNKVHIIYIIVVSILIAFGTSLKFSTQHEKLPIGCDEFGYLNMAKAFDNNVVFDNHTSRPFLKGLLDTLQTEIKNEQEYLWMIVPHAYHLSSKTSYKIINQYALGTSLVISFIPINYRQNAFPFMVMFLICLLPLLVVKYVLKSKGQILILGLTTLFLFIMHISPPFVTELARINSLALTFSLFIITGLTLRKKPLLAIFCIALSVNFRVINALMLLPIAIFIFNDLKNMLTHKLYKQLFGFVLKAFSVALIGVLPYITYTYLLLGNPLLPTYPAHDTAFVSSADIMNNLKFYFNPKEAWFIFLVITVLILFLLKRFNKVNSKDFFLWLLFPIINYGFFVFHKIQINYYPFATSFILLGAIIYYLRDVNFTITKYLKFIPITIGLIILGDGIVRYSKRTHKSFNQVIKEYAGIKKYDIVWGDMLSGTAEYACNNNGFKYNFSTSNSREIAFKYLKNNNYTQVILCDDNLPKVEAITAELKSFNISFKVDKIDYIGNIIIIN